MTADHLFEQAVAAARAGRLDIAEAHCHKSLAIAPRHPGANLMLGIAAARGGREDEAIARLETVLEQEPNNFEALKWFAGALAGLERFEEAATHAKRAAEMRSGDYALALLLGKAYHGLGRSEDSILAHRRAINIDPTREAGYLALCEVFIELGRLREAREVRFEAALMAVPAGPRTDRRRTAPGTTADDIRAEIERLCPAADIGLSVIVRDAEAYIRDLARSVLGVFTQFVFVDTGSTDRTAEILAEYGFEVHRHPFIDFADARNAALARMRTPWVMFLDADDVLPRMTALLCQRAVISAPGDVGGFYLTIQAPFEKGNYRVEHLKIVRRSIPDLAWDFEIHEQIQPSVAAAGFRTLDIPGAYILHLNYDDSPEGQAAKRARDFPLLETMVASRPTCPFSAWCMGMTLEKAGRLEEALTWFDRVIERSPTPTEPLRKAYLSKGRSLRSLGNLEGAYAAFYQGLALFPSDPELAYMRADLAVEFGRYSEALEALEAVPSDGSAELKNINLGVLGPWRTLVYARALIGAGRREEGYEGLKRLMTGRSSEGLEAARTLFRVALAEGDLATAETAVEYGIRRRGPADEWVAARAELAESRRASSVAVEP